MRRAVVTSAATAAGVVLLLSLKPHQSAGNAPMISSGAGAGSDSGSASAATGPGSGTASGSGAGGATGTVSSPSAAPVPASGGATRKVSGDTVNTRYGPVQVQVTLAGSRITAVDVVKYPTEDRRDREINGNALPVLNQEAISAQSAQIDAVSGATYTSDGYVRSLQSALDRAKG
ncbi:FMN-binding protein [Kitasatospora sp. SUK 42]|uniref:FMN-binding protein n=1 Tax=Kitasatospora sp. SUK 42 TaxID=1588882 RepID=UPI0018CBEE82|nr:FMN-binding protein [Kitasatospora sp. SUK 42]MBV2155030.1 FMN-binding protein [Kitasatospora sp. SUK 42]